MTKLFRYYAGIMAASCSLSSIVDAQEPLPAAGPTAAAATSPSSGLSTARVFGTRPNSGAVAQEPAAAATVRRSQDPAPAAAPATPSDPFAAGALPIPPTPFPAQIQETFATAFGNARQPEPPRVIQVSEIADAERAALLEDLQILETLIHKAISGRAKSGESVNMALGVPLYRSEHASHLTWIQDAGLVYSRSIEGVSLAPRDDASPDQKKEGQDADSEWEAARRELQSQDRSGTVTLFGQAGYGDSSSTVAPYDEERIETLKQRLAAAMKNAQRIRFPQSSAGIPQTITISLTCPNDGSALTIRSVVTPGADGGKSEVGAARTWQHINPAQSNSMARTRWGTRLQPVTGFLEAPATINTQPAVAPIPVQGQPLFPVQGRPLDDLDRLADPAAPLPK